MKNTGRHRAAASSQHAGWVLFVCWWNVHTAPDKTRPTWKRVWQTFEQSKYKMQRLNFFVVQQSLEWNTVMQIGRGAAIMEGDMVRTWPGCSQTPHCASHLIVKVGPQLSSLFVHLQFSGKSGEENSWEKLRPFIIFNTGPFSSF